MIDEGTYGGRRTGAYLAWFDDENGEEGAAIGQEGNLPVELLQEKLKSPEKEYWTIELAAKKFAEENGMELDSICGWVTESKATFRKYKAAMLAALEVAKGDTPMPPWVELALAAGWKMPKGWKP